MEALEQSYVPTCSAWQLNERMYGLCGRTEAEASEAFGEETVRRWAKSFVDAPPPVPLGSEYDAGTDLRRYGGSKTPPPPCTESLRDTMERVVGYWEGTITPGLRAGGGEGATLIVSHANAIRALMAHLDGIPVEEIWSFEIPRAVPIVYGLDHDARVQTLSGSGPGEGGKVLESSVKGFPRSIRGRFLFPDEVSTLDLLKRSPSNS